MLCKTMGRRKNVASQLHHRPMIPSSKDEGLGGDFITDVEVEVTFFPAVKGGFLDGWKFCERFFHTERWWKSWSNKKVLRCFPMKAGNQQKGNPNFWLKTIFTPQKTNHFAP